jgi:hypothetical protein
VKGFDRDPPILHSNERFSGCHLLVGLHVPAHSGLFVTLPRRHARKPQNQGPSSGFGKTHSLTSTRVTRCIGSCTSRHGCPEICAGRIEKSELTRFRNGCQRRATARRHPSRRVHRRDGERHGVACDILQRRRGALQYVTAGGDVAAGGGRDSARFTERTRHDPPRQRRSPRSGRSTGSRELGPPVLHGE